MQPLEGGRSFDRRAAHRAIALSCAVALALAACGKAAGAPATDSKHGDVVASTTTRVSACALMPLAEINSITGESFTVAQGNDDGHSSQTGCRYTSNEDPAHGLSLDVSWIDPSEYSDPVEHAALQKASIGGAKLGGKLTAGMPGSSLPGLHNGPVDGVGDEATQSMLLLTARKGDHTVMVQLTPSSMMAFLTDSTVAIATQEKEKTVARKVLEKL